MQKFWIIWCENSNFNSNNFKYFSLEMAKADAANFSHTKGGRWYVMEAKATCVEPDPIIAWDEMSDLLAG